MLSDKNIKQFQKIYRAEFGEKIGKKEALEKGIKLINLIKMFMDCIPEQIPEIKDSS